MSPEQARGDTLDARTDLFAFGAVLYQMATGRKAFSGPGLLPVMEQRPELPSSVNRALPSALDKIILKALEKKPADRYQTAPAMQADLQRLKSNLERSRFVRPAIMATASLVILAALIALM